MVRILSDLKITNDQGGLVYSAFALSYGIGQLVNGLLCRRYNPKFVIAGALAVSALVNILMPLSVDYRIMAGLWFLNGVVQSMLYCLIIRTLSRNVKSGSISGAIYVMSTTVAVGTALAYGISALFVALDMWRVTFFIAAVLLLAAGGFWIYVMTQVERARTRGEVEADDASASGLADERKNNRVGSAFAAVLTLIALTAIANGFIKDGVNNWLPKFLQDEYSVDESLSIILTLLLPVFSILGSILSRKLYLKLKSHLLVNGILYGAGFLFSLGVYLIYPLRSVAFTMVLFIGLAAMMAAVNNVITSMFPLDNRSKMDSGLLAGLLDTLCYVGSSAAGVLLGSMSQGLGWESVLVTLFVMSLVAAVLSVAFSFVGRK